MDERERHEIVETYLHGGGEAQHDAWWAITGRISENPEEAWQLIRTALRMARTDMELAIVGAGPLEDVISEQGDAFLEQLCVEARNNPAFVRAYTAIFFNDVAEAVWRAIDAALLEVGVSPELLAWEHSKGKPPRPVGQLSAATDTSRCHIRPDYGTLLLAVAAAERQAVGRRNEGRLGARPTLHLVHG